ncbi:MAG TPA: hypothetical protein PLI07_07485 [Candidatus Hydrogenedentes bacterium]|nr:hypothetical protein [Candidatus Hydrogenedentota bacterium]
MPDETSWSIVPEDLAILRELGKRVADIAHDPVNLERKRAWYAHDEGRGGRPLILAENRVAFDMIEEGQARCQEEWARSIERGLRFVIYEFERVKDDHVVEPYVACNWKVNVSDYGVASIQHYADRVSGNVSSRCWEAPIKNLESDLEKLRPRTYEVDREATWAWKRHLEEVFDGVLGVRLRGGFWWTTGLTGVAIDLVGLQEFMMYMCADPEGLHRLMRFLQAECIAYAEWLEKEGLLSLNNENDYIGSGSMGYTNALPQPGRQPGDPVRLKDLWVLSESQETVSCGPDQCEEFVLQYYRPIVERFGRTYYGCCEPVHDRWQYVKTLPNLKRVSISPWCDQAFMAGALGRDYVFSRKPNPTLVSTPYFDEDLIREDLRLTVTTARDCNLEIIMKDVHTLCGDPTRLIRWVQLAREAVARHGS